MLSCSRYFAMMTKCPFTGIVGSRSEPARNGRLKAHFWMGLTDDVMNDFMLIGFQPRNSGYSRGNQFSGRYLKTKLFPVSFQFSKPALNLSFEVERRSATAEGGGEDTSYYSTPAASSSTSSDFSPLDHIRDRILGVGHGRRAAGGRLRREAGLDSRIIIVIQSSERKSVLYPVCLIHWCPLSSFFYLHNVQVFPPDTICPVIQISLYCCPITRQGVLPTRICSKTHIRSKREGGRIGSENWSDMHFAASSGHQYFLPAYNQLSYKWPSV